jgi:hypothetical protein
VAQDPKARQQRVFALAERQDDVVSVAQLLGLGFSREEVKTRVRRGELTRIHRGVFAVSRRTLSGRGWLHAALLTAGPCAFLSHRSAAAVYGLRKINRREIHVTVPGGSRQNRDNLILHRSTILHPDDVRVYDGFRVSSIPWMLIQLAPRETRRELERLITESARRDLLPLDRLAATLDRACGTGLRGLAKLHRALGDYVHTPRDASTLERDFAAFLAQHPEIPGPARNVHLENRYELDFYWREQRLAVELDGRLYHQSLKDRERDNAKDIWLQKRGIRIVRIRDLRFEYDKAGIHADLLAFLAARQTAA